MRTFDRMNTPLMQTVHEGQSAPLSIENRWDAVSAAGMNPEDLLPYRSNVLGSDRWITNFDGGNTFAKLNMADPLTRELVSVPWSKGSSGDLGTTHTNEAVRVQTIAHNLECIGRSDRGPHDKCDRAYAQALLVDREALVEYQESDDALMAAQTLKCAFTTDVQPILARPRESKGAAIDPVSTYRRSGYRAERAVKRLGTGGVHNGIV
jgi:hypothetical protein